MVGASSRAWQYKNLELELFSPARTVILPRDSAIDDLVEITNKLSNVSTNPSFSVRFIVKRRDTSRNALTM